MATLSPTSPKTTEEIESLKSLVSDTLLKRGVLGKIKAQLRASVFAVLQESEEGKRLPSENSKVQALRDTGAGQLAFDLVWDFLQYLDLEYTLAVFKPEASLNKPESSPIDAAAIAVDLDLPESTGSEKPLLLRMLESRMSQKREGATAPKNKPASPAPQSSEPPNDNTPLVARLISPPILPSTKVEESDASRNPTHPSVTSSLPPLRPVASLPPLAKLPPPVLTPALSNNEDLSEEDDESMKSDDVLKKMDEIMLSEDATPSLTADLKSQEKPTSPPPDSSNVSKPLLPAAAPPSEKDPKSEPTIDRKEGTPSSVNDGGNKSEPKPALPPNRVDAKDDISEEIDESIEEDIDESSEPDPKSESDFITSDRSVSPSLSTGEFDHSELVE